MLSCSVAGDNVSSFHYNIAENNPFRYRGYYFDKETGFYYLQSRYYDPVIGRFLNADSHVNANGDLIGYNMYAYCSNNPVMNVDPDGEAVLPVLIKLVKVALTLAAIGTVVYNTYRICKVLSAESVEAQERTIDNIIGLAQNEEYELDISLINTYNPCKSDEKENSQREKNLATYTYNCQSAAKMIRNSADREEIFSLYNDWKAGRASIDEVETAIGMASGELYQNARSVDTTILGQSVIKRAIKILQKTLTWGSTQ